MTRILLTAFEAYDRWPDNSSWLSLIDLTSWYDGDLDLVTRRYPVDLTRMSQMLRDELRSGYDFAIHLGQSPGATVIKLESMGLNVRTDGSPLIGGGPQAYRSSLNLAECSSILADAGIPSEVSHHAGTYLCNAAMYLSQHYCSEMGLPTKSLFIHLPLTPGQVARDGSRLASMSTPMCSAAIAMLVEHIAK
ncbi:pyroglutamyl-peptidase I family protein [Stieleria varia]|uniref:Pyrrolidone-carboxylate peptidase n=1 Tax=Stieleria varia TaxID=2528005 RepID=A0A5C6B031_9BACT|nr:pyroglutamyl-peptidase I [Stieleria varia]TWU05645.1 Pyrrolidone-carboxylate peptidase [Stieleria varia]